MPRRVDDSQVFQLKVTLRGIRPPIWRRIQLRGSTTLPELHGILQTVMGWHDAHLHAFMARGVEYGEPAHGLDYMRSERRVRLDQLVSQPKDRIDYQYDFGDSWDHVLLVEKVLPVDPAQHYPRVLTGKRASPPEDVGGIWGYANFLEAMRDPQHEERDELLEWAGGEFDPEAFDLEAINLQLRDRAAWR